MKCRYSFSCLGLAASLALTATNALCDALTTRIGTPIEFSSKINNGQIFEGIRLLGALKLGNEEIDGFNARELSGLAWDQDEEQLITISDNGFVMQMRPEFTNGFLTDVILLAAHPLRDQQKRPLQKATSDSEGLVLLHSANGIRGDTELVISFEIRARIGRYTPTGYFIAEESLPDTLLDMGQYAGKNAALEALTRHDELGFITAPQRPLKQPANTFTLYGLGGQQWYYTPMDQKYSNTVGLETMPSGDILVLERYYKSFFHPVVFALRRMHLSPAGGPVAITDIVRFSTSDDWTIDNFESIAHHQDNRYFMVSDDNRNVIQKTLLIYFEILPSNPNRTALQINTP